MTGPGVQRAWRDVAIRSRKALEQLDYPVPLCLPGEIDSAGCTGSEAEHAASYAGALLAVVERRIRHLGPEATDLVYGGYATALAELDALEPCERGH